MGNVGTRKAFLGVGWAFPPCVGSDGGNAIVMYEDDVRQSIRIILGTDKGERVMRPNFGAGLRSFVFGPMSSTALQRVKTRVQDALTTWEPRIDVMQVKVTIDPSERSKLLIDITYRVRSTNTLQNLVFPFYLQEGSPQ
jgi:phage baseplate assembly protein W